MVRSQHATCHSSAGPRLIEVRAATMRPIEELCSPLTSCPALTSTVAPLVNGGSDYSARTAPSTHTAPAFVGVPCKPWGFDYVNAVAKYFWVGAMANCEKMYLNPASHAAPSRSINNSPCAICGYDFEAVKTALGPHAKTSCELIIDIGANQGWWMLPPTSRCWRVLAIEPVLANVHQLKLNGWINGFGPERLGIVHAAASNATGWAEIFSPRDRADNAAMTRASARRISNTMEAQSTRTLRLDEYFAAAAPALWESVRYVKIDTQGHELPALQGLGKLLETAPFPDVQVELDEALQAAQGHSTAKVHAFMKERCYEAWCAGPNGMVRHQDGVSGACRAGGITKDDVLFRHKGKGACAGGR